MLKSKSKNDVSTLFNVIKKYKTLGQFLATKTYDEEGPVYYVFIFCFTKGEYFNAFTRKYGNCIKY